MKTRLKSLTIQGIKNIGTGKILLPNSQDAEQSSVLGIYGQNGSGKTAVIDALKILQTIISGETLNKSLANYIDANQKKAKIKMELFMVEDDLYAVEYIVEVVIDDEGDIRIVNETISKKNERTDSRKITFINYSSKSSKSFFGPKSHLEELLSTYDECAMDLIVAERMAKKSNSSYIFNESSFEIFSKIYQKYPDSSYWVYSKIIRELKKFILLDLFVISNTHSGVISAGVALPMAFRIESDMHVNAKGDFAVPLSGPTTLNDENFEVLNTILDEINTVLFTIIPGMKIGIHSYGRMMMDNGEEGTRFELISEREGSKPIPIRMESEGIIKIISILNALIHAFADSSVCLAIDELDAGIFEYMLGELLDVFKRGAKGQLLFTSHNLRALEMLDVENIVFSTANPDRRYIHMTNIRPTNNLRDAYLKAITLGGQKEPLYTDTDSLRIARAFRKSGRKLRRANG